MNLNVVENQYFLTLAKSIPLWFQCLLFFQNFQLLTIHNSGWIIFLIVTDLVICEHVFAPSTDEKLENEVSGPKRALVNILHIKVNLFNYFI